jgi:hypothetical protein
MKWKFRKGKQKDEYDPESLAKVLAIISVCIFVVYITGICLAIYFG